MSFLSDDDITQAEHYTKQTEVKRWLILMLYSVYCTPRVVLLHCTLWCVKNVSKRVFKNPLAFFAAILCILMGYLAKKGFQRMFAGGKLTSKQSLPF